MTARPTSPETSLESLLEAGEAAARRGDEAGVRSAVSSILPHPPADVEGNSRLGELLARLGRQREAAERFEAAAEKARQLTEAATIRAGVARFRSGRKWEGLAWLERMEDRLPCFDRIAEQVADLRLSVGDTFGAIRDLARRLESDEANPRVHIALGDAYVRLGAYQMAARHYHTARALEPERIAAALRLRRLGDRAGAEPLSEADAGARFRENVAALTGRHPGAAALLEALPSASEWSIFSIGGALRACDRRGRWVDGYYGPPRTGPDPGTAETRIDRCPVFLGSGLGYGLRRFLRSTEEVPGYPGKALPVYVIEPDADLFRSVLRIFDWAEDLRTGRLVPFVGPGAMDRALDFFASARGEEYQFPTLLSELAPGRARSFVWRFDEVRRAIDERSAARLAKIREDYARRSATDWLRIFGGGAGRPIRVLCWMDRFRPGAESTAAAVAASFAEIGHEARIVTEEAPTGRVQATDVLRRVDEFRPDLVLLVGRTRRDLGGLASVPIPSDVWTGQGAPRILDPLASG